MKTLGDRSFYTELGEMVAPGRASLLVIDMQNDYTDAAGDYARRGIDLSMIQATVPNIARLCTAARAVGVPVLYSMHTILPGFTSDSPVWLGIHANGGLRSLDQTDFYTLDGTWGQEIYRDLEPGLGDVVFKKFRSNCFVGSGLNTLLRSRSIETVICTGQVTQGCVENTVRTARDMDYYAVMVSDAVASTNQANHDATFFNLGKRLPCPTTEELLACWAQLPRDGGKKT